MPKPRYPKPTDSKRTNLSLGYVVGLPSDDPEASLARSKFEKTIEGLYKAYPMITEARATVKISSPMGERRHFEVQAFVRMPRQQFEFTEEGWSLAETFDGVVQKLKRLRTKPEIKPSYRRQRPRQKPEFGI